ncbi:uncharacterized protein [Nicotiana tomentosiformis]|uniref:uncharacterized protein n=1 Tax=Nicotiana tomentosiformis TaxID=4098 RepID=UPI00388C7B43
MSNLSASEGQTPKAWLVGTEHRNPMWKWEMINMDFVVGLPCTACKFYTIWVIVDRLTQSTHLLPVKATDTTEQYAQLYIKEIAKLHGTPVSIILDRGAYFTAYFWKDFQQGLGTQMAPSEALYGWRCRSLIGWFEIGGAELIGPDLVHRAMEKFKVIKDRLKTTQSRQKSYSDVRRRDLEFKEDDWVFLKVYPMKGIMQFGKRGKIEYQVGGYPTLIVPVETIEVNEDLTYEVIPIDILDRHVQKLRKKEIASVKVLWRN